MTYKFKGRNNGVLSLRHDSDVTPKAFLLKIKNDTEMASSTIPSQNHLESPSQRSSKKRNEKLKIGKMK